MATKDWKRVIRQACDLGAAQLVLIGGEPTTYRNLPGLLDLAFTVGMDVRLCTSAFSISDRLWNSFMLGKLTLQVSYYSDSADDHDRVTGITGSHAKTTHNIATAIRRGIPVEATVIDTGPDQAATRAVQRLKEIGVTGIRTDRVRHIGRAYAGAGVPDERELCGRCADDSLAVLPDGFVVPCVLGRWIRLGNVKVTDLGSIVRSRRTLQARDQIRSALAATGTPTGSCQSNGCAP